MNSIRLFLQRLSFRTGVIIIIICAVCYAISFAQFLLPISVKLKGILWAIFFGLAKTFQYTGLTIIGAEGLKRLRNKLRKKRDNK